MFGTSGIRGPVGEVIRTDLVLNVGRALASQGAETVVVGRDPRPSGATFADALSAGVRECGGDVVRVGVAATPTIARSVGWLDADAGVSITGSHNPPSDNGLKLWTDGGQAFRGKDRHEVIRRINRRAFARADWDEYGTERTWDNATETHRRRIVGAVDRVDDLSAVVDVGSGCGGGTARALSSLGCTVETLNARPDGRTPARPSEPTAEHCATLCRTVAATDADFGIAHDSDADRMIAVTDDGTFVPGDVLLALFASEFVESGGRVCAPINASRAVDDAVAAAGGEVVRTAVGDVSVAARAIECDATFAGEPSGTWIWPAVAPCPDGLFAAAQLAALIDRRGPLSALIEEIEAYPIRRRTFAVDDELATMEAVRESVVATHRSVDRTDGVRVDRDDGWFLIRASGTEPVIRVTAEATDDERSRVLFGEACEIVARAIRDRETGGRAETTALSAEGGSVNGI
ncbi:phosphoglucosamine mutase [Halegenticoccus tardaugens]|uniref:phosphoglucosamine mutase n=1 Tax=Halegenticoccus tardaugens TaxID=2071624 RepID=UPI00100BD299|nr:phosphoglucosamine mutase [Halegenticoccus tardaugens]